MPAFLRRVLLPLLLLPIAVAAPLEARAGDPLQSFANDGPAFDPLVYFTGHTRSWGVFETRSGEPKELLFTETWGRWEGGALHFEQDLVFGKGKKQHRSWLLHRIDRHHFSATGTGIVGTAYGATAGNVFHLEFTLDAIPGNPLGHVHMSQWMYLQKDGVTMVNRDCVTKAGVIVTGITEQFRKLR